MARDYTGFEQGRRRDDQGRPLKIHTPPANKAYAEGWDRIFKCSKCGRHKSRDGCWYCATAELAKKLEDRYG